MKYWLTGLSVTGFAINGRVGLAMSLQLWVGEGGYFFVDTPAGFAIQVGQAFRESDGSWVIEVNNQVLTAPDLETAKRLFVLNYDKSLVKLSPGSSEGGYDMKDQLEVEDLSELQRQLGR